jgi:hypothetical protein
VGTKRIVSMLRVCLNLNTKAVRNGLEIRIFPAATRTYYEEYGRGTAGMRELAWRGRGTALYVWIRLYSCMIFFIMNKPFQITEGCAPILSQTGCHCMVMKHSRIFVGRPLFIRNEEMCRDPVTVLFSWFADNMRSIRHSFRLHFFYVFTFPPVCPQM